MHANNVALISGIPRSGTTLCCHILNQQSNTVALHEPIRPDTLNVSALNISAALKEKTTALANAIYNGQAFEHGSKGGLLIDNPVGDTFKDGKRQVSAKRGLVTLPQYQGKDFQLIVKQNAFFTAYLRELNSEFNILCIVRNPVEVLLSWWTVDLPVSQGRLPAGSKNDPALLADLTKATSTFDKQCVIYRWFSRKFSSFASNVLKYEDIISTSGLALTQHFGIEEPHLQELKTPSRTYAPEVIEQLEKSADGILAMADASFYSQEEIKHALEKHLA